MLKFRSETIVDKIELYLQTIRWYKFDSMSWKLEDIKNYEIKLSWSYRTFLQTVYR